MARDRTSQKTRQLDAQRYFTIFRRLLERTAGPVGLVWGLTTVAIGVLTVLLFEPVIRLLEAAAPSPKVLLVGHSHAPPRPLGARHSGAVFVHRSRRSRCSTGGCLGGRHHCGCGGAAVLGSSGGAVRAVQLHAVAGGLVGVCGA